MNIGRRVHRRILNRRLLSGVLALAAGVLSPRHALGTNWDNTSGGSFHIGTNWDTGVVPGNLDPAVFNLGISSVPGYLVSITSDVTNNSFHVRNDHMRLSVATGVTYTPSGQVILAQNSGDDSMVSFLGGGTLTTNFATMGSNAGAVGTLTIQAGLWDTNFTTTVGG